MPASACCRGLARVSPGVAVGRRARPVRDRQPRAASPSAEPGRCARRASPGRRRTRRSLQPLARGRAARRGRDPGGEPADGRGSPLVARGARRSRPPRRRPRRSIGSASEHASRLAALVRPSARRARRGRPRARTACGPHRHRRAGGAAALDRGRRSSLRATSGRPRSAELELGEGLIVGIALARGRLRRRMPRSSPARSACRWRSRSARTCSPGSRRRRSCSSTATTGGVSIDPGTAGAATAARGRRCEPASAAARARRAARSRPP